MLVIYDNNPLALIPRSVTSVGPDVKFVLIYGFFDDGVAMHPDHGSAH